ncbi:MAG: ABC transporter substrate-binding protein [Rhizobiales bacterium]|nr:ABC transporter substrate-binding protein [Hyphomicrobiales bacterium]
MLYSLALLDRKNPFQRIVGWKDDLIKFDPDAYRKYLAIFPEAANIKNLGSPYSGDYSIETLITSDTQVVFLNLGNLLKAQESGILTKLEKAGIAVVFLDFRQRPTLNTVPSLQIMARVLDKRDNADEFIDFYVKNMSTIYGQVVQIKDKDKPIVFIERAAGYNPAKCCSTFGSANMGRLVDLAGGINWGTRLFPGFSGSVNPEALFVDDPDVIIGTGANWAEANPDTAAVLLGYEAEPKAVQERLSALANRRGWPELSAVKSGRFHTVYHQFYNSPYHFVAMQAFAKWANPELFKDLDPEATFIELHDRFLPIDYSGVFWATLEK